MMVNHNGQRWWWNRDNVRCNVSQVEIVTKRSKVEEDKHVSFEMKFDPKINLKRVS